MTQKLNNILMFFCALFLIGELAYGQSKMCFNTGHSDWVYAVDYSDDGRLSATGSKDSKIALWDNNTGLQIGNFIGHSKPVKSVVISKANKYIFSSSEDSTIIKWDLETENIVKIFKGHLGCINSIVISENEKYLISASQDKTIKIWDAKSGNLIKTLVGHESSVNAIAINSENSIIISGSSDKSIKVWSFPSGNLLKTIVGHTSAIYDIALSEDSKTIVSGGYDKTVRVWDIDSQKERFILNGHGKMISAVKIFNNGKLAITGQFDEYSNWRNYVYSPIIIWDIEKGIKIKEITNHGGYVLDIDVSPNDANILIGLRNNVAKIWSIHKNTSIKEFTDDFKIVNSLTYSHKQKQLLISGKDNQIKMLDFKSGNFTKFIGLDVNSHFSSSIIQFNKTGDKFILNNRNIIELWDIESGAKKNLFFDLDSEFFENAQLSYDDTYLLALNRQMRLKVVDVKTTKLLLTSPNFVKAAAFYKCCNNLLEIGRNITVWDIMRGEKVKEVLMPRYLSPSCVEVSPDDKFAIIGGWNGDFTKKQYYLLRVDLNTFQLTKLYQNPSPVTSVSISPDSQFFVSGDDEGNIVLYDSYNTNNYKLIKGHSSKVNTLTFLSDEQHFVSGANDGVIKLWNTKEIQSAITILNSGKGSWIMSNPDNYYMATKEILNKVGFRQNMNTYTFDQFDLIYNRPDLLIKDIPYVNKNVIELYYKAYLKRLELMVNNNDLIKNNSDAPSVEISNINTIINTYGGITSSKYLTLAVSAKSSNPIHSLNIWINGVPLFGRTGSLIEIQTNNFKKEFPIVLSKGVNHIQVGATNSFGVKSLKESLEIEFKPQKEQKNNLYFIGICAALYKDSKQNLNGLENDVRDFIEILNTHKTNYDSICIDTVFNDQVTKSNVSALEKKLKTTTVDDVVIIYYCGHGKVSNTTEYYLGTYSFELSNPDIDGLNYNDLEKILDHIPARKKLLIVNACQSGEYNVDMDAFQTMKMIFPDLRSSTGTMIITSSAGDQFSMMRNDGNNSEFGSILIAVSQKSKHMSVNFLKNQLEKEFLRKYKEMRTIKQKPTFRGKNLKLNFNLW